MRDRALASLPGRVLVLGASGQVGIFLLPRLLARGIEVLALSRKPPPDRRLEHPGLRWVTPATVQTALPGCTGLVSAGPLALAAAYAREMPDLLAMSLTSSSSVLVKGDSPSAAERAMINELREAENRLLELAKGRASGLLLLRPTLLYGCGMDRNVSLLDRFIRRFHCLPLSREAEGKRQPLHVDDLAAALVQGLKIRETALEPAPLCGGETLSYRDMAGRIFRARGLRPRFLSMPAGLLAAGLELAGRSGIVPGANGEMVRRQSLDLVFNDEALRARLQLTPRGFHPGEQDFEPPTVAAQRRLAGLD